MGDDIMGGTDHMAGSVLSSCADRCAYSFLGMSSRGERKGATEGIKGRGEGNGVLLPSMHEVLNEPFLASSLQVVFLFLFFGRLRKGEVRQDGNKVSP
ncbi:hypothetical protein CDAR_90851 [Caerostris darwini]|uniref:Uncharacterized protein n=1 Tax=Caerostris darwini TaxID=1538125 RepID=A0AAV4Q866_9ARAC|nr:hypothetical protein CDAR_90851 [Caerostris darwini]